MPGRESVSLCPALGHSETGHGDPTSQETRKAGLEPCEQLQKSSGDGPVLLGTPPSLLIAKGQSPQMSLHMTPWHCLCISVAKSNQFSVASVQIWAHPFRYWGESIFFSNSEA